MDTFKLLNHHEFKSTYPVHSYYSQTLVYRVSLLNSSDVWTCSKMNPQLVQSGSTPTNTLNHGTYPVNIVFTVKTLVFKVSLLEFEVVQKFEDVHKVETLWSLWKIAWVVCRLDRTLSFRSIVMATFRHPMSNGDWKWFKNFEPPWNKVKCN